VLRQCQTFYWSAATKILKVFNVILIVCSLLQMLNHALHVNIITLVSPD